MCVLLCANPNVCEWIDMPLAMAQRASLQALHVCTPNGGLAKIEGQTTGCHQDTEWDTAKMQGVMKRSAWIQAYCQRIVRQRARLSPQTRHHPLEAITNAWIRLLVLVGWRR